MTSWRVPSRELVGAQTDDRAQGRGVHAREALGEHVAASVDHLDRVPGIELTFDGPHAGREQ